MTASAPIPRANARLTLGAYGEALAAAHLLDAGYELLDRNWRCRDGEIDLVVRRGRILACVEVRTRRSSGFGHPLESITPSKLGRMRVALAWRAAHPEIAGALRLDVIAVRCVEGCAPEIVHLDGIGDEGACA